MSGSTTLDKAAKQAAADAAREKEEGPWKADAQKAVAELLKDPASAQFRNVVVNRAKVPESLEYNAAETIAVCGEVNSKNGYGGYAGYTPFAYSVSGRVNGKPLTKGMAFLIEDATERHVVDAYYRWC